MIRQLFVTDLDGTLLNNDSIVSQRSARILSSLSDAGALITVATARTPATVEPLLKNIPTRPPAIVLTGAALWNRATHTYISPHFIPQSTCAGILAILRAHRISPMVYTIAPDSTIHTYYSGSPSPKERIFIGQRSNLPFKRMIINSPDVDLSSPLPSTILIFAIASNQAVRSAACALKSVSCSVSAYPDIFDPSTSYLEIFAPGISKASAVQRLKSICSADRLIVFGDNLNDLPMMAVADLSVAVGNALPQVKEAADIVIGPNTDDSVARFISEQFADNIK